MYTCDMWERQKWQEDWPLDLQILEAELMSDLVASQVFDIDDDNDSPEVAPPLNPNAGATSQIWNGSAETSATERGPSVTRYLGTLFSILGPGSITAGIQLNWRPKRDSVGYPRTLQALPQPGPMPACPQLNP